MAFLIDKHHARAGITKAPAHADVECKDCGNVGPAHSITGEKCPGDVLKSLARMARAGHEDAILGLFKAVGADRASQLINPHYKEAM